MFAHLKSSPVRWKSAGLSDVGLIRSSNQDAFVVDDALGLWVVADGMGGRAGGNIASSLTVRALLEHFKNFCDCDEVAATQGDGDVSFQMRQAIQRADEAVRGRALEQSDLSGMGTTIVAAIVASMSPLQLVVGHVGDSRAYLYGDHVLQPLTRDHSLVEDLLARGQISPEDAATHPQRHILVRALGIEGQTEPDIASHAIQPGDIVLLCTDGITKMLSDSQIMAHLDLASHSPDEACKGLVSEANARGGKDNSTAVVVRFA
jgi:protein phosphatase